MLPNAVHANETMRVINNTKLPLRVDYELPIYSRADTQITPIKSQQELQDLLYEAILTNSTQEIMEVIRAGADVNLFRDGKAPLKWAIDLKKLNSAEVLKRCGAIMPCPKNMLYRAILNDSPDEIKMAIQAGADINDENQFKEGLSPLGWAVSLTKSKATQALLECGASTTKIGRPVAELQKLASNPIAYALAKGDIKTALLLLKHSKAVDTLKHGSHMFECALKIDPYGIEDEIFEFLQELINRGYDINSSSYTTTSTSVKSAWISAICSRFYSVKTLELLMKNGANPSQLIYNGGDIWTPLSIAIQHNKLDAVKYLQAQI